ncbi:hypothetical protein ACIHCX_29205 [Streptomyces sp. NPDC052043]|uniref:hypothetical protein n=1 Tax=Streptomyces sp. NPDC052043 TaxID=3365684 RepID=UPI0037D378B8
MARDERRSQLEREAVDTLTAEFVALRNLARRYPEEDAGEDEMRPFRLEALDHHLRIDQALVRLPNEQLRIRIGDVTLASQRAFQGFEDDRQTRFTAAFTVTAEALGCLGASLREEEMPPLTSHTAEARRRRLVHEARRQTNSAELP